MDNQGLQQLLQPLSPQDALKKFTLNLILVSITILECNITLSQKRIFISNKKDEWYTYTSQSGKDNDTAKVFQFEKDVMHVSGAETGYIATKKSYSNFHFTVEFKWGEKRYPPRENQKREISL